MPDFDISWLIKELDSLGLKLTATRRLDGTYGLNRWRSMSYWDNAQQVEALWSEHVGDDPEVMAAIAEFVGRPDLELLRAPSITPDQRNATPR